MKIRVSAGWVLMGLLGAGCHGNSKLPPNQAVQTQVALESFNSCQDLQQYVQDTAVLEMRSRIEQSGHWGPIAMDAAARNGAAAPAPSGPSAFTTTNTQVAGVDEADFMKNDGTRIFVITGDTLYMNQSWPPASLATTAHVDIEGYPRDMFLDNNNHVIVFSGIYNPAPWEASGGGPNGMMCSPYWCGYNFANTTKITVVDVSDLAHPAVVSQYYEPGSYSDSRRVNNAVRMVTNNELRWPQAVQWWIPYDANTYNDPAKLAAALAALENQNEQIIRATPIDQWLQASWYKAADGSIVNLPYDCSEFRKSNTPEQLGVVSIVSLDLSPELIAATAHPAVHRTSILSEPGQIYASATSLYVAATHWWWWPEPGQFDYTYFHRFDITDPLVTRYVASGGVAGYVRDQFSMDEFNGYFRVATTIGTRVPSSSSDWGEIHWTNRLSVLGTPTPNQLSVVGATPDISDGESITSARFLGNKAFVSTYQYVDPLLAFDLTDPTRPTLVGQLQIPGSSTYLQAIDDNHLLAIGEYLPPEANGSVDWSQRTLQLSMFDVTDLKNPQQTFVQNVGTGWGWSEAEWDHKAFNYFADKKLLAIPYFDYQPNNSNYWSGFTSELRVFGVDATTGFTPKGALSFGDIFETLNNQYWTYYWSPVIRRSVMADDYVYAVSDSGIRVANVNSLSSPIATVLFSPYVDGNH